MSEQLFILEQENQKLKSINQELAAELNKLRHRRIYIFIEFIISFKNKIVWHFNAYKNKFFRVIKEKKESIDLRQVILDFAHKHKDQEVIIALPTVDWDTKLYQRPQHLALQLADANFFYIYGTLNHFYDHVDGFIEKNKNLLISDKYYAFLENLSGAWVFLLSTQQLTSINDLKKIKSKHRIIYDYVDEIHSDVCGTQKTTNFLLARHRYIMENQIADLVLCVSNKLYQEALLFYPPEKVVLSQNGVDYQHFLSGTKQKKVPHDISEIIKKNKPIIGYYGAIANWLDYDLLNYAAENNPSWQFVYIGVDYNGGLSKLDQHQPNVHFLGAKDYQELPQYGTWFDVALIPFARGEIASSTSPLKMYEYMALKKPIVVTQDLLECYNYEGVLVSQNKPDQFVQTIKEALALSQSQECSLKLAQAAQNNTWKVRAQDITSRISQI